MSTHEDIVRRGYDAFSRGDMDTLRSIMTPDVVQHVPGNSQIAGEYKGVDNVLGYYQKLFELTNGSLTVELKSVTDEGSDKTVANHVGHADRKGKTFDDNTRLTFTFSGDKISRLEEQHDDMARFDDFWS